MTSLNSPTPANHYVDNVEFQAAMVERRILVDQAKDLGKEKPPVSEYIGTCIYQIARHLGFRPNFIGYSYREELIGDGIENCLRYLDNYDAYNYSKPFAYFTQINWYAFIRRIKKEKKESAIKTRLIREIPFETFDLQAHDESGEFTHAFMEFLQQNDNTDTTAFDKKVKKPKKKAAEASLDSFIDEPLPEELVDDEFEGLPIPEDLLEEVDDGNAE